LSLHTKAHKGSKHGSHKSGSKGSKGGSGTQLPSVSGNKLSAEGGKSMSQKDMGQYAGNRDTQKSSFGGDSLDT